MAIHGNSFRFVPLYSSKVQNLRVHRHTQNIIPEKSGRQVVDGGRYAAPPLQLGIPSPCALRGVGVAAFWGDGSGGSSCARMRAGAATGRTAPSTEAEPAADRLRSYAESSAHRQPPAARQSHPATERRCESAAARMVGGGTHSDRGRNAAPPVLPTSVGADTPSPAPDYRQENDCGRPGNDYHRPTFALCPPCAPAPSFRQLSRGSTTQKPRFTDRSQTNA